MKLEGRVEIAPYGADSKSARKHQAFLVTPGGERLRLRRYDGPPMRDTTLEAMDGQHVVAEGQRREQLFIATDVQAVTPAATRPASETAPSASGKRVQRKP